MGFNITPEECTAAAVSGNRAELNRLEKRVEVLEKELVKLQEKLSPNFIVWKDPGTQIWGDGVTIKGNILPSYINTVPEYKKCDCGKSVKGKVNDKTGYMVYECGCGQTAASKII